MNADLTENETPLPRLAPPGERKFQPKKHTAWTQRALAIGIVALLGVLYIFIIVAFSLRLIDGGEMAQALAATGGLQTLAAAIVGFYFGSRRK